MNYGQIKNATLKLVDEYSSRGAVQGATKIADLTLKIQDVVNDAYYDLASTVAKIDAVQVIDRTLQDSLVEYSLATDFMDINYLAFKLDNGEYQETSTYQIIPGNKIVLPSSGVVYHLFYYKKPTLLVFGSDNVVNDAQTLELSEEAIRLIPYYAAGTLMSSEGDSTKGSSLTAQYYSKKNNITQKKRAKRIINAYNI